MTEWARGWTDANWLAERFEENRGHLRAVAYRMLGSLNEADDAVQEGWLRLSRSDTSGIRNLGGWLTTVVAGMSGHAALAPVSARGMLRRAAATPLGVPLSMRTRISAHGRGRPDSVRRTPGRP
jgi:hypothetical protein